MTTIAFDDFHADEIRDSRSPVAPAFAIDLPLAAILARKDDRLLTDVGLTREDLLGPEASWRAERETLRGIWSL